MLPASLDDAGSGHDRRANVAATWPNASLAASRRRSPPGPRPRHRATRTAARVPRARPIWLGERAGPVCSVNRARHGRDVQVVCQSRHTRANPLPVHRVSDCVTAITNRSPGTARGPPVSPLAATTFRKRRNMRVLRVGSLAPSVPRLSAAAVAVGQAGPGQERRPEGQGRHLETQERDPVHR